MNWYGICVFAAGSFFVMTVRSIFGGYIYASNARRKPEQ